MKYARKRKTKKRKISINKKLFLWVAVSLFIIAQVFFTIQNATSGAKLTVLEEKEQELLRKKTVLSGELIETTALSSIEKRAEDLGFSKPQQVMYINTQEAVAALQ